MLLEPIPRRAPPGSAARSSGWRRRGPAEPTPSITCSPPTGSSTCRSSGRCAAYALSRVLLFVGEASGPPTSPPKPSASSAPSVPELDRDRRVGRADLDLLRRRRARCRGAVPAAAAAARGSDPRARACSPRRPPTTGSTAAAAPRSAPTSPRRRSSAPPQMEVDTGLTWIVANVVLVAAERPEALELWDRALARSHEPGLDVRRHERPALARVHRAPPRRARGRRGVAASRRRADQPARRRDPRLRLRPPRLDADPAG